MRAKNTHIILLVLWAVCGIFSGCEKKAAPQTDGKISVTVTIFPPYDFVRTIAGDRVRLNMLLPPGSESHSFEPSPRDIITIQNSDIFICIGGESEAWVDRILDSMDTSKMTILRLMDTVDTVDEEVVEGMETEDEDEGPNPDEHIWTSPKNAARILNAITSVLCEKDGTNAALYRQNESACIARLDELDDAFQKLTGNAKRKTIIFGDRFPFRYFTDTYGLDYFAAFYGCSTETGPSAATVAFLINKVRSERIPVVFFVELSNEKMADTICEATGAKKLLLHACHNISKRDFEAGVTYLELMQKNAANLREALE